MQLSAGPVAYSPTECDDPGQRDSRLLGWGYVSGAVKGKGKGPFYLTSVVPSVPTRLLSMEADDAPSTPIIRE